MLTDSLITRSAEFVKALFNSYDCPYLLYHNLLHTRRVVAHSEEIGSYYKIDSRSHQVLVTAAWFHDTGQLTGDVAVHEERSVKFMEDFFADQPFDPGLKAEIAKCIMATKMPVVPHSELEKIICDADTYHLGTGDFLALDEIVWKEFELRHHKTVENKIQKSIAFLEEHQFYTGYCQEHLTYGKNKNIAALKSRYITTH